MPIIWRGNRKEFGKSSLFNWEEALFEVIKIRSDKSCVICQKEIKKGCYCLGLHYWRVCINCSDTFMENFQESLKEQIKKAKETNIKIKQNMGEYIKNNLINSV